MEIDKIRKELKVYKDKLLEFYGETSEESQEFEAYLKVVGKVLSKAEEIRDVMVFLTGITGGGGEEFRVLKNAKDLSGGKISLYLTVTGTDKESTEVYFSTYNRWGEIKIKSKLGVQATSSVGSWKNYNPY